MTTQGLTVVQHDLVQKMDKQKVFGNITNLSLFLRKNEEDYYYECIINFGSSKVTFLSMNRDIDIAFYQLISRAIEIVGQSRLAQIERLKRFDKNKDIIINGTIYSIDNPGRNGFAGAKFIIKHNDGSIQITNNLWQEHVIDPQLRVLYPDTAQFMQQ